jgi:hypothetical protein
MNGIIQPTYQTGFARYAAESAYPELWRGLVGMWRPSLGQSNALLDRSGYGNDGILNGFASPHTANSGWQLNSRGMGLRFDGTDDYVNCGAPALVPTGNDPRTFSFWFSADVFDTGTSYNILTLYEGVGNGNGFWIFAEDNAVSIGFSGHRIITPKATLSTGVWYHVAAVVPVGAINTADVLVYIDGINQALSSEAGASQVLNSDIIEVSIGSGEGDSAVNPFDGFVDEVAIYNRELSQGEIVMICRGASPLVLRDTIYGVAPVVVGNAAQVIMIT